MYFSAKLSSLAAFILPFTSAFYKGVNVAANNPDGSCKTEIQWEQAFNQLKGLPQHITSVRLFASSDCNTLANAVPAALKTGTGILVGVWTEDQAHYNAEKNALVSAIQTHGSDWIIAVSVGSEDLYRKDTTAAPLAAQINEVRSIINGLGVHKQVGHVDTWNVWVAGENAPVIKAADFIGLDAYPYFQGSTIQDASQTFWTAVNATRKAVSAVDNSKWVWVTETSWPVSGNNFGASIPSVQNAQTYWRTVACEAFRDMHIFWYAYQDYNANPSFGIFGQDGKAIYDLSAC